MFNVIKYFVSFFCLKKFLCKKCVSNKMSNLDSSLKILQLSLFQLKAIVFEVKK